MKSADEIFDGAADLYDTGQLQWIQFKSQDGLGGACMGLAVYLASDCVTSIEEQDYENFHRVSGFASSHLGQSIPAWNDTQGRTQQEVVDKLRELAKHYRERTQQ